MNMMNKLLSIAVFIDGTLNSLPDHASDWRIKFFKF